MFDGDMPTHEQILPIEARDLILIREGRTLLQVDAISVRAGGLTAILGPNGAGKSLLLRCLAGLMAPDAGLVLWAGARPTRENAAKLGFVFQKPVLLRRTAIDNVRYALKAANVARPDRHALAAEALKNAGLEDRAETPARVLSGGEQQRLAIARALAMKPDVLFLDEPTANLDPSATLGIEAMTERARQAGTTVVLVTHDIGQARRLGDTVIFMHGGRIDETAPAKDFFDSPASSAAQAFLAGNLVL